MCLRRPGRHASGDREIISAEELDIAEIAMEPGKTERPDYTAVEDSEAAAVATPLVAPISLKGNINNGGRYVPRAVSGEGNDMQMKSKECVLSTGKKQAS